MTNANLAMINKYYRRQHQSIYDENKSEKLLATNITNNKQILLFPVSVKQKVKIE